MIVWDDMLQVELKVKSAETRFQEEKLRIQRQHEDSLKQVKNKWIAMQLLCHINILHRAIYFSVLYVLCELSLECEC